VSIFANETCPELEKDVLLFVGRFSSLSVWMERGIVLPKQEALFDYNTFILDFIGIHFFYSFIQYLQAQSDSPPPHKFSNISHWNIHQVVSMFNVN